MIVAAALCPAPPLLIRELNGAEQALPGLRQACLAAVSELMAAGPDLLVVVGTGERTATWDPAARLDLSIFAPGPALAADPGAEADLPPALGVAAWLLDAAGYAGRRSLRSVSPDEPSGQCAVIGASIAAETGRTALLVMADGSARRGPKAPGYFDQRGPRLDAVVERAVRSGDLTALAAIDPDQAAILMATGRPGWQVLAGAVGDQQLATRIRYKDDPFGVAYLVASLRPGSMSRSR